jgi:hypothetical protein
MIIFLGGLRAADPWLTPVWRALSVIPRPLRIVAGIALPILFSISRFGPGAAGREIATARSTLIISAILAYVLMHPGASDAGNS